MIIMDTDVCGEAESRVKLCSYAVKTTPILQGDDCPTALGN